MPSSRSGAGPPSTLTYGYIQAAWLPMQDGGTTSMLIQLSRAFGAAAAGGAMWLLVKVFWGRRKLVFYNMFALIVVCMTLYLMGIIPGGAPYPYVGLMNIAHKVTFLFVWLAPFLIPSSLPPLCWWCVAMGTYQVGKIASNLSLEAIGVEGCSILTLVTTAALFICFAACVVIDQGRPSFAEEPDPEPEPSPEPERGGQPGGEALLSACAALSEEYGLSCRR